MGVRFDKIDALIIVYDGTGLLISEKWDVIYNKISYLITTYVIPHNYTRNKVDSYDFLHQENVLSEQWNLSLFK